MISSDISKAAKLLTDEDVVAIPTETVYGLAGNIFSEKAIRKIYALKQRPLFNPLIVHISSIDQLSSIASEIPEAAQKLAAAFWPGPLTLIFPKKKTVPSLVTAGKSTVAVRIPSHSVTLELLQSLPFPLAAPSANPFGSISPTSAEHVDEYFGSALSMVLEGGSCQKGIESTIVGFENELPVVYRLGSIAVEDLESVAGKVTVKNKKEEAPNAPGMLSRHYAPNTPTYLVDDVEQFLKKHAGKKIGVLLFTDISNKLAVEKTLVLSRKGNLAEAATNLYAGMHLLDRQGLDMIVAQRFPDEGLGRSINDRLTRATKTK